MKLQHLRFFVAAVDCGGVVKAAEHMSVSQPAVSAGLKSLEHELGQPLFDRVGTGRRIRPTPKALEFYKDAIEILKKCDLARTQFQRKDLRPEKVRIGLLSTIATHQVVKVAQAIQRERPDLRVQFREGGRIQLEEWLRRGRIDVAWTVIKENGSNRYGLWQEPFAVLVNPAHRFARSPRDKLLLSDLRGEDFVLRGSCEIPRGRLWPEGLQMRVVARAERDELAFKLVEEGLGIAIAPRSLATGGVIARLVEDMNVSRSIGITWRKDLPGLIVAVVQDAFASLGEPHSYG